MAKLQFLGWVGGRWADNVPCMHVHTWEMLRNCCVVLAYMFHATKLTGWRWWRSLHVHTFAMLCSCTQVRATQLMGMFRGGKDVLPCMCIHVRCYGNCALLLHTGPMLRIRELVQSPWHFQHFTFAPLLSLRPRTCIASDVNMFPDVFWKIMVWKVGDAISWHLHSQFGRPVPFG